MLDLLSHVAEGPFKTVIAINEENTTANNLITK